MELIAKASGGADRPLPEAGLQHAVLYSVIDLGTQETTFNNTVKNQRKINVSWELPHLPKIEFEVDGEKVMKPQAIFKSYTLSLFEKANLAKDLSGWRGTGFTKEEENGFNVFSLLEPGVNALLQVVHYIGNDGKTRAKYESIAKLMQGMAEVRPLNPICQYTTDMHDDFPPSMPEWAVEAVKQSPEYQGVTHAKDSLGGAVTGFEAGAEATGGIDMNDIPF